jgi:hypothetical protein
MSRSWSDLSTEQRAGVVALGTFQVSLQIAALVDIRRRPAEQIKGRKATWVAVSFIIPSGRSPTSSSAAAAECRAS